MSVFVQGWILGNVLGEGAYGEVRLVINETSGEKVAMKIIDLVKHPDAHESVKKETAIHSKLSNPNIIMYFGQRSEKTTEYIFLEYACGGELFDRIEPDMGMEMEEARKLFLQLISAVEYLHSKGIAHRDLKPENLLLDANDNLKVSDFGLATLFRAKGKERILDKRCGTLPYVAPEVLERPYHAQPADVWSCGIILVAMLSGELPWDVASKNCLEYIAWKSGNYESFTPWKKLDQQSLKFVQNILKHNPSERLTVPDIKNHTWCTVKSKTSQESSSIFENSLVNLRDQPIGLSQPVMRSSAIDSISNMDLDNRTGLSFSQPMKIEDLLVSSQFNCTQASQNQFQNLVRRMTRFFASASCEETVKIISEFLKKYNYQYHLNDFGILTISTVDKRKMPLVFKINIMDMDHSTMVDFRLSKGCGIEFKKEFMKLKKLLKNVL